MGENSVLLADRIFLEVGEQKSAPLFMSYDIGVKSSTTVALFAKLIKYLEHIINHKASKYSHCEQLIDMLLLT